MRHPVLARLASHSFLPRFGFCRLSPRAAFLVLGNVAGRARQAFFTGSFLEGTLLVAGVPALDELVGVVSALGGMVFRVVRDGFLSEVCSEAVLGASGAFCKHRICCWIKVCCRICSRCNSRTDSMSWSGMEADAIPAVPSVAGAGSALFPAKQAIMLFAPWSSTFSLSTCCSDFGLRNALAVCSTAFKAAAVTPEHKPSQAEVSTPLHSRPSEGSAGWCW